MDNYQTDFNAVQKEVESLEMTLNDVADIKKKNPAGSVVQQEFRMRQSNIKINQQMLDLENLASEYQNSGSRFNINVQTRQKRIDQIVNLKKKANTAQA